MNTENEFIKCVDKYENIEKISFSNECVKF
jgi:hypothetical protein